MMISREEYYRTNELAWIALNHTDSGEKDHNSGADTMGGTQDPTADLGFSFYRYR